MNGGTRSHLLSTWLLAFFRLVMVASLSYHTYHSHVFKSLRRQRFGIIPMSPNVTLNSLMIGAAFSLETWSAFYFANFRVPSPSTASQIAVHFSLETMVLFFPKANILLRSALFVQKQTYGKRITIRTPLSPVTHISPPTRPCSGRGTELGNELCLSHFGPEKFKWTIKTPSGANNEMLQELRPWGPGRDIPRTLNWLNYMSCNSSSPSLA